MRGRGKSQIIISFHEILESWCLIYDV
jgi:hypothetical protein